MRSPLALCFLAFFATACATAPTQDTTPPEPPRTAWIVGADGRAIGQASLTEAPSGVLIRLEFSAGALTPGWHGAHIHERGDCADVAAGFQASGAHVDHDDAEQHGLLNELGPESGDLPNIFAPAAGPFGAEMYSPWLTLGAEPAGARPGVKPRMPLLDADGSALVIHAGPDDHFTQPIGGAGARVGCAVISARP